MKPIAFSPYMDNIPMAVVGAQKAVIDALLPDLFFGQAKTIHPHGSTLNIMLASAFDQGFDVAMLMDIDAIPLCVEAVEYALVRASDGVLIGNIQRSNHIQNGGHLFVAPSFMAINVKTWNEIGRPSFCETARGDVAEEVTYAWEQSGMEVEFFMPMRFDAPPIEAPHWELGEGMPVYGCQTTFGKDGKEYSYHAFQISHQRNVDAFVAKCHEVVRNG